MGVSQPGPADVAARTSIGLDRFMWGSDYPHDEGTYPFTREHLRQVFHDVDAEPSCARSSPATRRSSTTSTSTRSRRSPSSSARRSTSSRHPSTSCPTTPTRRSSASSANRTRWPPPDSRHLVPASKLRRYGATSTHVGEIQVPVNSGGRFSAKARAPSLASLLANTDAATTAATWRCRDRAGHGRRARSPWSSATASGAFAAICSAIAIASREHLARGHDPVHQSVVQGTLGVHRLAGERELERDRGREPERRARRRAHAHQSPLHLGEPERGVLGGHDDVAAQHHPEPAGDCGTVHRSHDRLRVAALHEHRRARAVAGTDRLAGGERLEVHARAERLVTGTGEYDRPHLGVGLGPDEGVAQLPEEVAVAARCAARAGSS